MRVWNHSRFFLEIGDLRLSPQVPEQLAAPRRSRQARHFALRIVQISEYQGIRRTGLNTGRLDFSVLHLAFLRLRLNLSGVDALHTERTLLHDADFAHRYVGIQLEVQRLFPNGIEKV